MILPFRNTFVSLSCESVLPLKRLKKTFFSSEVLLIFWQWLWPVVQGMGTAEHSVFKQLVLTLQLKEFYGWIRRNTWPTWSLVWGKTVQEHAKIQGSASLAAHVWATVAFVKRGSSLDQVRDFEFQDEKVSGLETKFIWKNPAGSSSLLSAKPMLVLFSAFLNVLSNFVWKWTMGLSFQLPPTTQRLNVLLLYCKHTQS